NARSPAFGERSRSCKGYEICSKLPTRARSPSPSVRARRRRLLRMYSRVTGPVWTSLGSTEPERVEKKFGSATRRIVERAIELGRPASVWGLEKKIFRAALEASVPRDHAVAAVRS